jgi:hypothetical protein
MRDMENGSKIPVVSIQSRQPETETEPVDLEDDDADDILDDYDIFLLNKI